MHLDAKKLASFLNHHFYLGDFMLLSSDAAMGSGDRADDTSSFTLYFEPMSEVGSRRCVRFQTVNDTIVEMDEVMEFEASATNTLDVFAQGNTNFSLTVIDDDGMYRGIAYERSTVNLVYCNHQWAMKKCVASIGRWSL